MRRISKKECFKSLRAFKVANKRIPLKKEFRNPSGTTICKIFGSWNNFLIEAGENPSKTWGLNRDNNIMEGAEYARGQY